MIGCVRDAPITRQYDEKEVEENTIKRRIQTAAKPIEKRSIQKLQEPKKRVNREPTRRKPNHNRMENIERAEQRLVL